MIEILTDHTREVWKIAAEAIMADSKERQVWIYLESLATARLRYEKTLQAKGKRIAALVRSMEEIKTMTHCDALGDRYTRARQVAIIAIKGATS